MHIVSLQGLLVRARLPNMSKQNELLIRRSFASCSISWAPPESQTTNDILKEVALSDNDGLSSKVFALKKGLRGCRSWYGWRWGYVTGVGSGLRPRINLGPRASSRINEN